MKARLENTSVQYRGVVLVSETEEERGILWDLWNSKGRSVVVGKLDDGNVELVVAPTPEKLEGEGHGTRES